MSSEPSSIGNVWPNSATSPSPRSRRSIAVAVAEGTPVSGWKASKGPDGQTPATTSSILIHSAVSVSNLRVSAHSGGGWTTSLVANMNWLRSIGCCGAWSTVAGQVGLAGRS